LHHLLQLNPPIRPLVNWAGNVEGSSHRYPVNESMMTCKVRFRDRMLSASRNGEDL